LETGKDQREEAWNCGVFGLCSSESTQEPAKSYQAISDPAEYPRSLLNLLQKHFIDNSHIW